MVRVAAAAVRVAPFFCNSAINSAASCTFGGATRTPAGCDSHSCGVRRPPLGASRGVGLPDSRLSAPRLEVGFGSTRLPGTPDSRAALRRLGRARDSAGSPRAGELWRGGCDSRPPSLLDRPSLRGPPLPSWRSGAAVCDVRPGWLRRCMHPGVWGKSWARFLNACTTLPLHSASGPRLRPHQHRHKRGHAGDKVRKDEVL